MHYSHHTHSPFFHHGNMQGSPSCQKDRMTSSMPIIQHFIKLHSRLAHILASETWTRKWSLQLRYPFSQNPDSKASADCVYFRVTQCNSEGLLTGTSWYHRLDVDRKTLWPFPHSHNTTKDPRFVASLYLVSQLIIFLTSMSFEGHAADVCPRSLLILSRVLTWSLKTEAWQCSVTSVP